MALTKCIECGNAISKSASQCPNCGAKVRRTSLFTKLVVGFFALVLLGMLVRQSLNDSVTPRAMPTTLGSQPAATQTPEQRAEAERVRREQEAISLGLRWQYEESSEQMGRGKVKRADVLSLNEVVFDFPYGGAQRGTLTLRIHPKYGRDVVLSIEKGQFLCGIDDCVVAVRFDDGKAQNYTAVAPSDHSTTSLFIRGYDRFVPAAKKAKRVSIEAQFYQQGTRVFEFDITDLKW
jgi:predicted nucleic acid-binding Zn ribbon protein